MGVPPSVGSLLSLCPLSSSQHMFACSGLAFLLCLQGPCLTPHGRKGAVCPPFRAGSRELFPHLAGTKRHLSASRLTPCCPLHSLQGVRFNLHVAWSEQLQVGNHSGVGVGGARNRGVGAQPCRPVIRGKLADLPVRRVGSYLS